MKNLIALTSLILLVATQGFAQRTSPIGKWKSIDDNSGETKSVVEIEERDGKLYGKILELFNPPKPNPVCEECDEDDKRYMKPIMGMEIIRGMEKDDDKWENGNIMDPENGKVYRCKLWVEEGKLRVRGYIAFLYRTQTWLPAD